MCSECHTNEPGSLLSWSGCRCGTPIDLGLRPGRMTALPLPEGYIFYRSLLQSRHCPHCLVPMCLCNSINEQLLRTTNLCKWVKWLIILSNIESYWCENVFRWCHAAPWGTDECIAFKIIYGQNPDHFLVAQLSYIFSKKIC